MRLEFNPRALCYNLYCDTKEEERNIKKIAEDISTNINSLSNVIYADTDSVKTMKTKLNSVYGKAVTNMNKDFVVVHGANKEVGIIFKDRIIGVFKHADNTTDILLGNGYMYYSKDKYEDVIKQVLK